MGELMYWVMFLACVSVLVMATFVMLYQRQINIDLRSKYNDLVRELNNSFGWEEWNWANNFREYARKVDSLENFRMDIERLCFGDDTSFKLRVERNRMTGETKQ